MLGGCRSIGDVGETGCILAVLHNIQCHNLICKSMLSSSYPFSLLLKDISNGFRHLEGRSTPRRAMSPLAASLKNVSQKIQPATRPLYYLFQSVHASSPSSRPCSWTYLKFCALLPCATPPGSTTAQRKAPQTLVFIMPITTACQPVAELGLQCWVRVKLCI